MANETVLSLDDDPNSEPKPNDAASQPNPATPSGDLMSALQELVGKGKKFENEEALAKGKVEADQFIDHLKDENKGLRDTITELQDKLAKQEVDSLRSQLSKSAEGTKTEEATPSQLSTEDLERLVEEGITKRETQRTAKENLDKTNRDLIAHFGDPEKASEAVRVRAEALGISTQEISKMAAKSPALVMELIRGSSGAAKVADITKTSDVDGT